MSTPLGRRAFRAFVSVTFRQAAGAVISAGGSILLARLLGAQLLGVYAVGAFFINLLTLVLEFGTHQYVIRARPEEMEAGLLKSVLTLRLLLSLVLVLVVFSVVAPMTARWYENQNLYWLLGLGFAATALASPFRISLSLLEKEMEYTRVGAIELLSVTGFYIPAVTLSLAGFGIEALVVGEVVRGLSGVIAYALRPFELALTSRAKQLRQVLEFGLSYLVGILAWMLNGGLNPLVVGKLVGLEAAGYVRVAEGIVAQAGFFKGIADRIAYPILAEIQGDRSRVLDFVKRWRLYQFVFGVLPLMGFAALGAWLIPWLYGPRWSPVSLILVLLCLSTGASTVFGTYSAALITVGRTWQVTRSQLAYSFSTWLLTPMLVAYFGYVGYPVALALAVPSYALAHRYFVEVFGEIPYRGLIGLIVGSWTVTAGAWLLHEPFASFVLFLMSHAALAFALPDLRQTFVNLPAILRSRGGGGLGRFGASDAA